MSGDGTRIVGLGWVNAGTAHAFQWDAVNGMVDLGSLGGQSSRANGISSDGTVIVGWDQDPSTGWWRAAKWVNGVEELMAPGTYCGAGQGVSSDGTWIVGDNHPDYNDDGWRWSNDTGFVSTGTLDTLLVHADIAETFLPEMAEELAKANVEMHCDERSLAILKSNTSLKLVPAVDDDWGKEFLALIAAVKVVDSLDEALEHVERYTSGHSEAIITEDYSAAIRFLDEVDAACVYVNASTRFTDGSQFGLGAEVGISTQKLHARGPLGLKELTTYKWVIFGNGQVRP